MNKEYEEAVITKYLVLGLMDFLANTEEGSEAYEKAEKYLDMLVNDEITISIKGKE